MGDRVEKGPDEAAKIRNRVLWCRQLAAGAADRKFAKKLDALAEKLAREPAALRMSGTQDCSGKSG